ncbi:MULTISPECIES: hypothetical protein [unclassified Agarivorans]|uniref:hypothetical protein n=1 Tax=unclassified Agarivorans TaxID=2636026 RepID=UPI003D7C67A7
MDSLNHVLYKGEALLKKIHQGLNSEHVEIIILDELLAEHQKLFTDYFTLNNDFNADDKKIILAYVGKMKILLDLVSTEKNHLQAQLGTLERSKKINKAYGK